MASNQNMSAAAENAAIRQKFGGALPFVGQPVKAAIAA